MCMIVYCPPGKIISDLDFDLCWMSNSDGGGLMYPDYVNDRVVIKKPFFNVDKFCKYYKAIDLNLPRVLHFRFATSGEKDKFNTHPHRLSQKVGLVHNGIIPGLGNQKFSDTYILTSLLINRHQTRAKVPENFNNKVWKEFIEREEKISFNKYVLLSSSGEVKIINEDLGSWEEGCWFSAISHWTASYCQRMFPKVEETVLTKTYRCHSCDDWYTNTDMHSDDLCEYCYGILSAAGITYAY